MYKLLIAVLFPSLIIYSCVDKKPSAPVKDKSTITESVEANDTTRKIAEFDKKLAEFAAIPDSLATYIKLNHLCFDSVNKWKGSNAADKYLTAILNKRRDIETDTTLRKELIYAYSMWCYYHNDQEAYNDSLVERLNEFLTVVPNDSNKLIYKYQPLSYLGIQYNLLGDLKKTILYHNQALIIAKRKNLPEYYASSLINYTVALNEMGLYDSTINLVQEILSQENYEAKRKAKLFINLAQAYLLKNELKQSSIVSQRGVVFITTAVQTKRIDSTNYFETASSLYDLMGKVAIQENKLSEASQYFDNALHLFLKSNNNNLKNREAGKLLLAQVVLCERTGELNKALRLCQKALYSVTKVDSNNLSQSPSVTELYTENTIMEALDSKAGVLEKMIAQNSSDTTLLKQIVLCYELAFAVERKLMQGFSYDESLMRQAKESRHRSERAVEACYKLYLTSHSAYWAEKALQFAETSKAVVLQESVKRNLAANQLVTGDTTLQQVQLYQQQVSYYEKRLAITPDSAKDEDVKLKNLLNIAEQNLLLAKTALSRNHSEYREALIKEGTVSMSDIHSKLMNKTTSVTEYFWGDSSQYFFHLTPNQSITFFKASSSLPTITREYLSFFADKNKINNEPQAYEKAAHNLFLALQLDSLSDNQQNLIIIPDGILSFVPFESLTIKISGSTSPKQFAYLLLSKKISYGFSAETLIQQAETYSAQKGISCFAPVFAGSERGNTPLLNTSLELNQIKEEKKAGNYFLKENASIVNFKKNIDNSIIHIASHARSDTSGGMPVIEFYDSTLYLNEIYTLPLAANLVVLSACETGIGKIEKSEGTMSLARGFYYAGAKNIITSLWSVDDKSTGILFRSFYHNLSEDNYSSALRESKLAYLHNASETAASPYYWAGFIHIGHSKEENNRKSLPVWMIIAAAGILLITAFSVLQKKK